MYRLRVILEEPHNPNVEIGTIRREEIWESHFAHINFEIPVS